MRYLYIGAAVVWGVVALQLINVNSQESVCITDSNFMIQLSDDGVFAGIEEAGRVEICVCGDISDNSTCEWQTVSTGSTVEAMGWKNSIVVCRELGYFDVQSPILQNTVQATNQASNNVQIYSFTFNCDGTESALIDCETGSNTDTLPHTADAYVHCQRDVSDRKIRLTGSTFEDRGIAEYYVLGAWRTICLSPQWTDSKASLVCRSLGFDGGTAYSFSTASFGQDANIHIIPTIQSVDCSNAPYYFSACSHVISTACFTFQQLAGVICSSTGTEGSVRRSYLGVTFHRVEVYYNGRWGTVCDTQWDMMDGTATCRSIGTNATQITVPTSAVSFNPLSSRPIWIYGFNCTGTESSLSSCPRPQFPVGFTSTNDVCSHSNDAGVTCVYTTDTEGGGLSGGAIAGIVIGVIVGVGLIVFFVRLSEQGKKRNPTEVARNMQPPRPVQSHTAPPIHPPAPVTGIAIRSLAEERSGDSTSSSSSSESDISIGSYLFADQETEFTQAPPPPYSEALKQPGMMNLPEYCDDEKQQLPYPIPAVSLGNNPIAHVPSAPPPTVAAVPYDPQTQIEYLPPPQPAVPDNYSGPAYPPPTASVDIMNSGYPPLPPNSLPYPS